MSCAGADPGFKKGGGAVGSGARSQYFFGQFRGLFKEFGTKKGGRATPSGSAPALISFYVEALNLQKMYCGSVFSIPSSQKKNR